MKKLSLLSLLWLVALVAMPTYAQDVQDAEDVVYNVETSTYGDDEVLPLGEDVSFDYGVDEDGVAYEMADDEVTDEVAEFDFNTLSTLGEMNPRNEFVQMTMLIAGIVSFILGILAIIALWKIFKKAGEKWWKAIIPIYNTYIMFKIVGMKKWFWWMLLVPFCAWIIAWFSWEESIATYLSIASSLFAGIVSIVASFKLPRKFGWGVFTSILYVLFTPICILILGFGKSQYQGKSENEPETIVEA